MCPHRRWAAAAVVAALIVALAPPAARAWQTTIAAQQAVFPVRVSDAAAGSRDGLCVAIAQEATGGSHLVYLITSARLVGSGADWTARIVVGDDTLVVGRADAMVDPGGALALLRAVSSRPVGTVPVFLESVPSGSPVVAAGFRANGGRDLAAAHFLRRGPVAVVVLDTTGRMDSRVGAPVLIDRGVLALATRDTSGSDVIVEELAGVGAFLLQRVPGLTSAPPAAPLFTRTDREINGPTSRFPLTAPHRARSTCRSIWARARPSSAPRPISSAGHRSGWATSRSFGSTSDGSGSVSRSGESPLRGCRRRGLPDRRSSCSA
jgi:hypothetical protein